MPTLRERFILLLDEGIDPNELAPEDLKSLVKSEAYESYVRNNEVFWHRDQEYVIGEDVSLEVAQMVCQAQWMDREDRLQFAHALFEDCLNTKMYPNLGAYIEDVMKETIEDANI